MHLDTCLLLSVGVHQHEIIFLMLSIIRVFDVVLSTSTHHHDPKYSRIANLFQYYTNANVYVKGSQLYYKKRKIHNGLCNYMFPDVIVEPTSTYDVSQIVKISRSKNVPISIRSGGHSYICASIKNGKTEIE